MIYFDNCSTTPIDDRAVEAMARVMRDVQGNPGSIHTEGRRAAQVVNEAREKIAATLGAAPTEIVFTSSGTESNNLAVATAFAGRGSAPVHVVTTSAEHVSILNRLGYEKQKRKHNFSFTKVAVDAAGMINWNELFDSVTPDTSLITLLYCNNETGALQDLERVLEVKNRFPRVLLHLDVVQSYGKIALDVRTLPVDMLTISAHKVHGPKGIGCLYVRGDTELEPLIIGGAQEKFRRAGTENVAGAAGFAAAVENAPAPEKLLDRVKEYERKFLAQLNDGGVEYRINGSVDHSARVPGILNLSFPGVANKEDLLIACDLESLMISSTSACHSGVVTDSHVLQAMGLPQELRTCSVRVCFSRCNTFAEIAAGAEILVRVVKRLLG